MTIAALVTLAWVVENLQLVGGGGYFHLAFNDSELSPTARIYLKQQNIKPDTPITIYWQKAPGLAVRVADGHLAELIVIGSTMRLHIRLLHVCPYMAREEIVWPVPEWSLDVF